MILTEKKIRVALKEPNDSPIKHTYGTMLLYYTIFDSIHGTRHADVLHTLYEAEKVYTLDGVAMRCHISRRTLDRNRKEYLRCFKVCQMFDFLFKEVAVTKE